MKKNRAHTPKSPPHGLKIAPAPAAGPPYFQNTPPKRGSATLTAEGISRARFPTRSGSGNPPS
ncbi:hypothetical protein CWI53_04175 [Neisseria meningitidis]|nr:hypothetical protein CWI53_04175 [Neisseria meningitidis]